MSAHHPSEMRNMSADTSRQPTRSAFQNGLEHAHLHPRGHCGTHCLARIFVRQLASLPACTYDPNHHHPAQHRSQKKRWITQPNPFNLSTKPECHVCDHNQVNLKIGKSPLPGASSPCACRPEQQRRNQSPEKQNKRNQAAQARRHKASLIDGLQDGRDVERHYDRNPCNG